TATITVSSLSAGSHSLRADYTPTGNFDQSSSTAVAETVSTPVENFVHRLYVTTLGRDAGPAEVPGWVAFYQQSGQAAVVASVEHSTEAQQFLVRGWYQQYLRRPPGSGEELGWVQQLQAGASREQVLAQVLGSQEYFNLFGNTQNLGFI